MNITLMSSFNPTDFPKAPPLKTTGTNALVTFLITVVKYLMGATKGGDLLGLMV